MVMCQKLLYRIQLPNTISFLRRIFEQNMNEECYILIIQFINGSKMYSTISLAKNMKLYIAVCCDIEYGTAAPSCRLLFYEQFSTVLKSIRTLVAEIFARWQCQHTFPDSGRTTFSRFLTTLFLAVHRQLNR